MKIFQVFRLGLWLRSPFGLRVEGYVKFLRSAFAEAATRRQANNITECRKDLTTGRNGHLYPCPET